MSAENAVVIAVGVPPEASAHMRQRLHDLGLEFHLIDEWMAPTAQERLAGVVAWSNDAAAITAEVRRVTAAPLMIITGGDGAASWSAALDAGADVCMAATVPASALASQLRALLRSRVPPQPQATELECGELSMDLRARSTTLFGSPLKLNRREFDLLAHLLDNRGVIQRRHELLSAVWGPTFVGDSNTVDVHVAWLRQKLPAGCGVRITTLRGLGYRLDRL